MYTAGMSVKVLKNNCHAQKEKTGRYLLPGDIITVNRLGKEPNFGDVVFYSVCPTLENYIPVKDVEPIGDEMSHYLKLGGNSVKEW